MAGSCIRTAHPIPSDAQSLPLRALRRLRSSRWSEPRGQRVREAGTGSISHPGDVSVGPDQYGGGSSDSPDGRKLPWSGVSSVDRLNPIRPWRDVEVAGLTEIEEHRPGTAQQREDP